VYPQPSREVQAGAKSSSCTSVLAAQSVFETVRLRLFSRTPDFTPKFRRQYQLFVSTAALLSELPACAVETAFCGKTEIRCSREKPGVIELAS
jgi:hypothetical protein